MDDRIVVPKLTPTNYQRWKFDIIAALESRELLEIVIGAVTCPALGDGGVITVAGKEWKKQDAKARLLLASGLNEEDHAIIRACRTSADMWARIISLREQSTDTIKYLAQQEFHQYRFGEEMNAAVYIAGLSAIVERLGSMGEIVSEATVIAKIMSDLPEEYDNFRQSYRIAAAVGNKLSLKNTQEQLLVVEADINRRLTNTCSSKVDTGEALVVKKGKGGQDLAKTKREFGKEARTCYNCGKKGHLKRDCHLLKQDDWRRTGLVSKMDTALGRGVNMMTWVADSGATNHMTRERELFSKLVELDNPLDIMIGDGRTIKAVAKGVIDVEVYNGQSWIETTLNDVLLLPELGPTSLFSIGAVTDKGCNVVMTKDAVCVKYHKETVLIGHRGPSDLYFLEIREKKRFALTSRGSLRLWHERLAHIAPDTVKQMARTDAVHGIEITSQEDFFCEGCTLGKMSRKPFKECKSRSTEVGAVIHSDVCGPMETVSLNKSRYFIHFKDDASAFRKVYFMKTKEEVLDKIKVFVAEQRAEIGQIMKELRTDNGTEFLNKNVSSYLREKEIKHVLSAPYNPEQNGLAERENRSLVEHARAMLQSRNMPKRLWAEATNTAAYVLNRVPNRGENDKTPFEKWFKKKPNIAHLRVFGTICYAHIPKQHRRKWEPKSRRMQLVGFTDTDKNFRLWNETSNYVEVCRDVKFDETTELAIMPFDLANVVGDIDLPESEKLSGSICDDLQGSREEDMLVNLQEELTNNSNPTAPMSKSGQTDGLKRGTYDLRSRPVKPSLRSRESYQAHLAASVWKEPCTFIEAIKSEDKESWISAMDEEMQSLGKNGTWTLIPLPPGRKAIKNRWVFKVKEKPDGSIQRFKARLVAKGFLQRPGIDYFETFAPVIKMDSLRTILAIVASEDMEMIHFDVKTAFLYGELKEEIYMEQPEGYSDGSPLVCKLEKGLYGLKQSPRAWNAKFSGFLEQFGFKRGSADPCVYLAVIDGKRVILGLYVDDGLLCSANTKAINQIIEHLRAHFEIEVDEANCYVGFQIERDRATKTLKIHQEAYIRNVLLRFDMSDCREQQTPADVSLNLHKSETSESIDVPFREAVGSLMYAMTVSRPDIAFAVGKLSRFLDSYGKEHWIAVKRVFRYLKGTTSYGITFGEANNLVTYCDSDFAGDFDTRRSTSGYVCLMNGGPIAWSSRIQKVAALSTTEAEYVSMAEATKQIIWLRHLLTDLGVAVVEPTLLFGDNQGAIKLVFNPEFHQRTKHIDVRYHFIREAQVNNEISVNYVPAAEQAADVLTKALHGPAFKHCLELFNFK